MADLKVSSNGNVTVWLIPVASVSDYRSPTATEINTSGVDVTNAIAWDSTTFPSATDSDDIDDRSLRDKGNATTRGAAQFEATLNFFRPKNNTDTTSDYGIVYNMLRTPGVPLYVVTRVLQGTAGVHTDASAGQWISVYRFVSDGWTNDIEGDDSYKYAVGFLTQGEVAVYTQVKNATAPTVTNASGLGATTVGGHVVLRATLGGKRATQVVAWSSTNNAVATVSPNGVVTGVSAGTTGITCTHPAATGASTAVTITVT